MVDPPRDASSRACCQENLMSILASADTLGFWAAAALPLLPLLGTLVLALLPLFDLDRRLSGGAGHRGVRRAP